MVDRWMGAVVGLRRAGVGQGLERADTRSRGRAGAGGRGTEGRLFDGITGLVGLIVSLGMVWTDGSIGRIVDTPWDRAGQFCTEGSVNL